MGTIGFSVPSGSATNTSGGTAPAFTSGDVLAVQANPITIDIDPPSPSSVIGNGSTQVNWVVTFNGADSITLGQSDINVIKTGTADGAVLVLALGAPNEITVRLVGITGVGTLSFDFPAGLATNTSGGVAPAGGPADPATVVAVPPPAPTGYAIAFADDPIQNPNTTLNLTAGNGEATNYSFAVVTVPTSGSPVTGSGTVTGTPQSIPIDVTSLANGTLQVNFTVSNSADNELLTDSNR